MRNAFAHRWISLVLAFSITVMCLAGAVGSAFADSGSVPGGYTVNGVTYDLIKGTHYYASAVASKDGDQEVFRDLSAAFYYSDGFFAEDPYSYNPHLATTSLNMAMSAYYSNEGPTGPDADYSHKAKNILRFMHDIGCEQIYTNKYNTIRPRTDSIGVTIGRRQLRTIEGRETGRTLIVIAIRGGNYEKEWVSNATLGSGDQYNGEAEGFASAAEQVKMEIDGYIERNGLADTVREGKVDFWISGYSRAGATTNLTARRLVDSYAPDRRSGNRVFAYCNEAPQGGVEAAKTAGNDYTCIHNVINKSDLVPRVAPSMMGFARYGVDHYIPGSPAGTPGGSSDNTAYAVGSAEYEGRKTVMLEQLKAINPNITFSDAFQVYGVDMFALGTMLAGIASDVVQIAWLNPLAGLVGLLGKAIYILIEKEDAFIVKGDPLTMDAFLDEFFTCLQGWTGITRARYSGGDANLQTAAGDFLAIVFDSTKEQMAAFKEEIKTIWSDQIKLTDLLGIFYYAFGEWHKPDFKYKTYYTNKFVNWIKESGAFDKLALTEAEKDQIFNKDLPVIADIAMTWLSEDYRHDLHSAKSMTQFCTFAANVDNILMNHYAEVNLAWLRTEDTFYSDKLSGTPSLSASAASEPADVFDSRVYTSAASNAAGAPELVRFEKCEISLEHGADLESALPETLTAYYSDSTEKTVPIEWHLDLTEWCYADAFGQEWKGISEYDPDNPRPMWAAVLGYYGDELAFAEINVQGLPEASIPLTSKFELVYDEPISVEMATSGPGTRIRYTLDGTDPRFSPTARDYTEPLILGSAEKKEDVYLLVYTVSPDPSKYNDSDVLVWHYEFSGKGSVTPTDPPRPVPKTGDSGQPGLWLGLMLLGIIGLAVPAIMIASGKRK